MVLGKGLVILLGTTLSLAVNAEENFKAQLANYGNNSTQSYTFDMPIDKEVEDKFRVSKFRNYLLDNGKSNRFNSISRSYVILYRVDQKENIVAFVDEKPFREYGLEDYFEIYNFPTPGDTFNFFNKKLLKKEHRERIYPDEENKISILEKTFEALKTGEILYPEK